MPISKNYSYFGLVFGAGAWAHLSRVIEAKAASGGRLPSCLKYNRETGARNGLIIGSSAAQSHNYVHISS